MLFGLNWRYGTIADCLMFHINELRHVALYQSNCNYENVFRHSGSVQHRFLTIKADFILIDSSQCIVAQSVLFGK